MKRLWTACAFLCLASACSGEEAKMQPEKLPLHVRTDREELAKRLRLPPDIQNVRWLTIRLGNPDGSRLVPGPTDTALWAWLEADDATWEELRKTLEPPKFRRVNLRCDIAETLGVPIKDSTAFGCHVADEVFGANDFAFAYPGSGRAARVEGGVLVWASTH